MFTNIINNVLINLFLFLKIIEKNEQKNLNKNSNKNLLDDKKRSLRFICVCLFRSQSFRHAIVV